eukprot:506129-Rhodomonas_salina.4
MQRLRSLGPKTRRLATARHREVRPPIKNRVWLLSALPSTSAWPSLALQPGAEVNRFQATPSVDEYTSLWNAVWLKPPARTIVSESGVDAPVRPLTVTVLPASYVMLKLLVSVKEIVFTIPWIGVLWPIPVATKVGGYTLNGAASPATAPAAPGGVERISGDTRTAGRFWVGLDNWIRRYVGLDWCEVGFRSEKEAAYRTPASKLLFSNASCTDPVDWSHSAVGSKGCEKLLEKLETTTVDSNVLLPIKPAIVTKLEALAWTATVVERESVMVLTAPGYG